MAAGVSESPVSILLVGTEPRRLDALEALLGAPGQRVVRAASAAAALAALQDDDFAVILVDACRPGLSGVGLAAAIERRRRPREVPIVFLTAPDGDEDLRGSGVGAVELPSGPLDENVLRSKVAVHVELFRMARELQRAAAYRTTFLSAMSQELRTPLNSIIGFAGTLLMRLKGPLNEGQEAQLLTVQSSARQLLSLIDDLLGIATIEAGGAAPHADHVVCQEAIGEVAETLRPLARQRGLTVAVEAPTAPVTALVDRRALTQILLHLASHAIRCTAHGGVRFVLRRCGPDGRGPIEIAVAVAGPGIGPYDPGPPPEPHGQPGEAGSRCAEGGGLGLHLSRSLAALIGAQLTCDSRPDDAIRFTLTLSERAPPAGEP